MNKHSDDGIQERAGSPHSNEDALLSPGEMEELEAYRELFSLLSEEPNFRVSPDFASHLAEKVQPRRESLVDWLPVVAVAVMGLLSVWMVGPIRSAASEAVRYLGMLPIHTLVLATMVTLTVYLLDLLLIRMNLVASTQ